jgi:type I restriction enzyme S subunit
MHNIRTAPNRSGWKKSNLGDFIKIKHGYAFKGEFFSDSGRFVLLTPGNFQIDGGLKLKGEKETYYLGEFPKDFILNKGDLIVAMTDLKQSAPILGSSAVIPESGIFLHNQRLGKIVDLREKELALPYRENNGRSPEVQEKDHLSQSKVIKVPLNLDSGC